jgi:hypothetical protein
MFGYFYLNPTYLLFALPALILGLYAQAAVSSAYRKYSRVPNSAGMTGAQAAKRLLDVAGLSGISVEAIPGNLTDNYDPRGKVLHLSQGSIVSPSIAAVAVVAHEVGHATQDAVAYAPLRLRSAIVPVVQLGSWLGPILFIIGYLASNPLVAEVGVIAFGAMVVFALITLPVELDASHRGLAMLYSAGILDSSELPAARKVLNAAALTYVAALVQALSTLLYYMSLLSGSRRR